MFGFSEKTNRSGMRLAISAVLALSMLLPTASVAGDKKKDKDKAKQAQAEQLTPNAKLLQEMDLSKIVWPNPPAIARVRYMKFLTGEKFIPKGQKSTQKVSWMDRLSGAATGVTPASEKPRFQLVTPYGVAVDSKGLVYVADSKVRAIFIFNSETGAVELIKNGSDARFKWLTGLVIDDADWLYAADSGMQRILVFDPQHKLQGSITEGLRSPGGLAVDNENRLLYVADAELDQVMVYDADPPFKLLRRIGKQDKNHSLTGPGEFSRPTNVAVDQDGNLYVADTWNDRVEIFDADGNFIRTFGKAGDGPGYFARPKGIAIDGDGHVWVADTMQDRVQVFTPEGRLLIYFGEHGLLPGQFRALVGLTIDKNNRVITTEQFPGRAQVFRYVTNDEAKVEKDRRDQELKEKKASGASAQNSSANQSPK